MSFCKCWWPLTLLIIFVLFCLLSFLSSPPLVLFNTYFFRLWFVCRRRDRPLAPRGGVKGGGGGVAGVSVGNDGDGHGGRGWWVTV